MYGFHVGKYTILHESVMGTKRESPFFVSQRKQENPQRIESPQQKWFSNYASVTVKLDLLKLKQGLQFPDPTNADTWVSWVELSVELSEFTTQLLQETKKTGRLVKVNGCKFILYRAWSLFENIWKFILNIQNHEIVVSNGWFVQRRKLSYGLEP